MAVESKKTSSPNFVKIPTDVTLDVHLHVLQKYLISEKKEMNKYTFRNLQKKVVRG